MTLRWLLDGVRMGAGRVFWALAAFVFPALAIVKDDSVVLAMALFVSETLFASLLLAVRVGISRRTMKDAAGAAHRLREIGRVLLLFVAPFSLFCALMLGALSFVEAQHGRAQGSLADFGDRAGWMALALVTSAALDSVLAPVRSVHWLESGVAWQASRTAVLFLAMLLGWPLILVMGTAEGFFWTFFGLRLVSDLGGLRRSERERIRTRIFDGAGDPEAPLGQAAQAPPPFSPAHARHDVTQSRPPLP